MEKKTIFVNLNFDDFHPQRDHDGDFGDIGAGGVLEHMENLVTEFPGLIVSLFTVPNWIDRPHRHHRYVYFMRQMSGLRPVVHPQDNEPFLISKHTLWCAKVKQLIDSGKFEIANHGYFHYNPNIRIHGQEFAGLSEAETKKRILLTEEAFTKAELPFVKAFRPPGWGTNQMLPKVLRELGYKIYAPYSSRSKTSKVEKKDGLLILPQNWSIRESPEEALLLAEKTGAVYMKGHMVYQYGKETIENGITPEFWQNLRTALRLLNEKYNVVYVSLNELANKSGTML